MKQFLAAILITASAFTCAPAFATDYADNDTPRLTPAQEAQQRAENAKAKAQWDKLTPDQKRSMRQSIQQKRLGDLSMLDIYADNDTEMLDPKEAADLKAERAAARAKLATMSPEEKAQLRNAARQKRVSELTMLEKVAGSGS